MRRLVVIGVLLGLGCSESKPKSNPRTATPSAEVVSSLVPTDAQQAVPVIIKSVVGGATFKAEDGTLSEARPGNVVDAKTTIRTESGQAATLMYDDIVLTLQEKSELTNRVGNPERMSDFQLEYGRLRAKIPEGSTPVRVGNAGSSAIAVSSSGDFAIFNDGRGMVAVAAKAGEVKLTSQGGDTVLSQGDRVEVRGDQAPAKSQIPRDVLLSVVWPTQAQKTPMVRGRAEPGTTVHVNGGRVDVGQDGVFTTEIKLNLGSNRIEVQASDLLGRERSREHVVRLGDDRPKVETDTKNLWN